MRSAVRWLSWCCVAAAIVVVVAAWVRARPELTPDDAIDFTEEALLDAGLSDVRVDDLAIEDIQSNPDGDHAVYRTRAEVGGGTIELAVRRDVGEAVFVRDLTAEGEPLLTDAQFARLGEFRTDPAVDRRIVDNLWVTGAAVLAGLMAGALATSSVVLGRRRALASDARTPAGAGDEPGDLTASTDPPGSTEASVSAAAARSVPRSRPIPTAATTAEDRSTPGAPSEPAAPPPGGRADSVRRRGGRLVASRQLATEPAPARQQRGGRLRADRSGATTGDEEATAPAGPPASRRRRAPLRADG